MVLELSKCDELKEKLVAYHNQGLRIGKLMELYDLFAGDVSYRYCNIALEDASIVTACVDNIRFFG